MKTRLYRWLNGLARPVEVAKSHHLDSFIELSLGYLLLRLGMVAAMIAVIVMLGELVLAFVWGSMLMASELMWITRSRALLARRTPMTKMQYLTLAFLNLVLVVVYLSLAIFLALEQMPLMVLAAGVWVAGVMFATVLVLVPDRLLMATTYGPAIATMVIVANLVGYFWNGGRMTMDVYLVFVMSIFFALFVMRAFQMGVAFQNRAYIDKQSVEMRRVAAERASVNKTAFLARLSHEIRTPLNGVMGCANLLRETELNPRQRHLAEQILNSGDGLLGVLNEVLDISKIELGGLDLQHASLDLPMLYRDCLIAAQEEFGDNGICFQSHFDPRLPVQILGDAPRLRQITHNLLRNAVQSSLTGIVTLSFWHRGTLASGKTALMIEVTEVGSSVENTDPDLAQMLRSVRVERAQFEKTAGLSLIISRDLSEQLGGALSLDMVDGGRRLQVEIPVVPVADSTTYAELFEPALAGKRLLIIDPLTPNAHEKIASMHALGLHVDHVRNVSQLEVQAAGARVYDFVWMVDIAEDNTPEHRISRLRGLTVCQHSVLILECIHIKCEEFKNAPGIDSFVGKDRSAREMPKILCDALMQRTERRALAAQVTGPLAGSLASLPGARRPAIPDLTGRRIVLAEEDAKNRARLQALLEPTGAVVEIARDRGDAMRLIEAAPTDLLLLDLAMAGQDGGEAARAIRHAGDGAARLRIIAVAARAGAVQGNGLAESEMDDYLASPVLVDDLYRKLQAHLCA